VAALKDSLSRGISKGALTASAKDGYYANPRLKIPFPTEVRKVEEALRKIGFGKDVDRFVMQLNRSAEKAAAKSKPIFIKAITSMTIRDAFDILNGAEDAATSVPPETICAIDSCQLSVTRCRKPVQLDITAILSINITSFHL
jgi:hypothetical protein